MSAAVSGLLAGVCQFCAGTEANPSLRGDGDEAGWGDVSRTWCTKESCAREHYNQARRLRRATAAKARELVEPILRRVTDAQRQKRERAKRRRGGRQ